MLNLLLRYIPIMLCGNYIYHKLLNLKNYSKQTSLFDFFSILTIIIISYFLPSYLQYLLLPIILLLPFIYFSCTTNVKSETIFTTLVISYSICYGFLYLSSVLVLLIIHLPIYVIFHITITNYTFLRFLVACLQIFLCILPFRLKRLKNGMPFLQNQLVSNLGVFTGSLILFCSMIISTLNSKMPNNIAKFYLMLLPFVFIFFIFIFIWWKNQIQQTYLLKLKEREFTRLEEQLSSCEQQLSDLKAENQELSKLIHRDNKLIPSMQLAVHEFMELANENPDITFKANEDTTVFQQKGEALLAQLEKEMAERSNIITLLSQKGKQLPSTNVPSVDHLLNYMLHRSMKDGIDFDFSLTGNVRYMTEEVLSETDCLTLLADLLENAVIATKANAGTHVFLHIGVIEKMYTIDVWDSGIPFTKETLYYLGKKRYTTHKKEGGSGIGLMSIYELAKKYDASLVIDETSSETQLYTKKISVMFDGKQQYRLCTGRGEAEIQYLSQRTDCILKQIHTLSL